jgi:polysaccharide deacetylase family protein (PEP-CTERM system associated)
MKRHSEPDPLLLNALTFDVEDWFHGMNVRPVDWPSYQDRLAFGLSKILNVLAEFEVRATFFVLAPLAESHPRLIRALADAGHEVGTHGISHVPAYRQTPAEFRDELHRSIAILEDVTGHAIFGHRAAFFSITGETLWALPILADAGLTYDASMFPIHNARYGIPDAQRFPHRLDCGLIEFPISTVRLRPARINLPFSGGAYARILPYPFIRWAIKQINRQGQPTLVYLHPWEFDISQPDLRGTVPPLYHFTHYHNLRSTEGKLRALLRDFRFGPALDAL